MARNPRTWTASEIFDRLRFFVRLSDKLDLPREVRAELVRSLQAGCTVLLPYSAPAQIPLDYEPEESGE